MGRPMVYHEQAPIAYKMLARERARPGGLPRWRQQAVAEAMEELVWELDFD